MDSEPGIDLVVCNYRTPGDLREFLVSLCDAPPATPYGLTVVNVCPEPEDRQVVEWAGEAFTIERYLEFPMNVGYAKSINLGALKGRREVIAAFNADVVLLPGALDSCHRALWSNPGWGVLGPRQVDQEGRFTHAGIFGTLEAPRHRGWHEKNTGQYLDVQSAVTVSGAAYFIKREVWDELTSCPIYQDFCHERAEFPYADGAFLPTKHYYEETFCSYHAQAHGWEVVYYGPATVVHKWHRASRLGGEADTQMGKSRELFRAACDAHAIPHD